MATFVKSPVTEADLAQLRHLYDFDADDSPLNCDLSGYSAEEALKYLMRNWTDAQRDDARERAAPTFQPLQFSEFTTASVLSDLDDTIDQLRRYRKAAEKLLAR